MRNIAARVLLLIATILCSRGAAIAQNLVVNSHFDDGSAGWDLPETASWSPLDAHGNQESGSLSVLPSTYLAPLDALSQSCVLLQKGRNYRMAATVIGSNIDAQAHIAVYFYTDANCSDYYGQSELGNGSPILSWTRLQFTLLPDNGVPQVTASARMGLGARVRLSDPNPENDDTTFVNIDDAELVLVDVTTTTEVPTTTLPELSPCGDPMAPDGLHTIADALFILRVSAGLTECAPCICDVDGSQSITVSDALFSLRWAVGLTHFGYCAGCP